MQEYQQKLVELLLEKNTKLSVHQAQTWVELLWDDFETTRAKAGREYKGSEMTEKIVRQWIENYGEKLHEFFATNPKYSHLFEDQKEH
ncbi:hypothetical protein J27TS8_41950 [Robertmurraya siralis]|uniref:WVELL protein n=1 Tax=Robertmurraya siralis TaxID=77777 RepID=A0A919WM21_9BACI|nr:YfhJ family protein [Robertmurraya siralis]GIN64202.1 hypothetical protein J27TS8_41950 [Robertmurraya siralis]